MALLHIKDFFKSKTLEQELEDLDENITTESQEQPSFKGQLTSIEDIIRYATAGNATLTLRSMKTQTRFTYKIQKPKEINPNYAYISFFVKLLNGPDNTKNYQNLGWIHNNGSYHRSKKSRITETAPSHIAFNWFWNHVIKNKHLPDNQIECWHEGTCCRCGRKLTVPGSVKDGIGPECKKHVGV